MPFKQILVRKFNLSCDCNECAYYMQSAIRKKMASRVAFSVDRHVGPKFAVFVRESDSKWFLKKINSKEFIDQIWGM